MRRKDVKIGMRVIAVSNIEGHPTKGREATIVSIDDSDFWNICVDFDDKIFGAWGGTGRTLWCNGRHIEPVPEDCTGEITLPFTELMSM